MRKESLALCLLIATAFVFRLLLAPYLTHTGDLLIFKVWGIDLAENGFREFYTRSWSDYLPGYLYVLFFLGHVYNWLIQFITPSLVLDFYLFKMPSILTDLGSGLLVYLTCKGFTSEKKALISAAFALFTPAFFVNSTFWGQADSVITFFMLLTFYLFVKEKLYAAFFFLGIAQVIKPIAVLSLPIYLLYLVWKRTQLWSLLIYCAVFLVTTVIVFAPFGEAGGMFDLAKERYLATANQYKHTSLNAFNFWFLASGFFKSDELTIANVSYHKIGLILFGLAYVNIIAGLISQLGKKYFGLPFALSLVYFSMFIFLTRMHERHMFYAVGFLTLLLPGLPKAVRILVLVANILYTVNLYYALAQLDGRPAPFGLDLVYLFSGLNIIVLLLLLGFFNLRSTR